MHCCWHWRSGKNSFFIILPFRRTLHSIVFQYIIYWKNYWHSSNINEWMWINPDDPSSSDNESPHRKSISRFLQCASHHLCVGASDLQCGKMAGLWHEYQWWEVATPEPGALFKYSISTSPLRTRKASIIKFASTHQKQQTITSISHPSVNTPLPLDWPQI